MPESHGSSSTRQAIMPPECQLIAGQSSMVRLPPSSNVPLTDRVRRILDTPSMRRLAGISQLGMVHLVYPGARHSRLEHTLGVYDNAVRWLHLFWPTLCDLGSDADTAKRDADSLLLAALVHDMGHWPFCHPIEDMQLESMPRHVDRLDEILDPSTGDRGLVQCIEQDWKCQVVDVLALLKGEGVDSSSP
ncbi:MAG: HD domain-containing protein, partial [Planctomycetota bacterium]